MARTYNSELRARRALENRDRVLAVATEMFCGRGWVSTTMADVATDAGVTRQTVYQQFPNKLALLDACIDHALTAGEGIPVRELAEYRAMGNGPPEERLAAGARWLCAAHVRSAAIQNVLDEAAVTDPAAAQRLQVREANRWDEVQWALTVITGARPADAIVDAVWLLAARRNWLRLIAERGWTPGEWTEWFIGHARIDLSGGGSSPSVSSAQ
ncbi:TetR/AcrR family transcriptional regulator [Gordonia sp. SL306]|uniref:TetR/AcrR family transcriptional regulator n=1 Tax=Gordonia sp. SL306 TaxID=2995145 RepID=UPI00226F6CC3|nr:TetR family transcriptional regulator [Gordonia sp. SL306]WAC55486.1 TetR family transcriptional regulator [Gordonia sp. SL306]